MTSHHRGSAIIPIVTIVAAVGVFSAVAWFAWPTIRPDPSSDDTNTVACTMEAKLCPDGTSVGRSGPKCEFAECPTVTNTSSVNNTNTSSAINTNTAPVDPTRSWLTYTNDTYKFSFRYPETWAVSEGSVEYSGSRFIHIQASSPTAQTPGDEPDSFGVTIFLMKLDETDPVRNFSAWTNYVVTSIPTTPITIAGIQGTLLKNIPAATPYIAALIDHQRVVYELQQGTDVDTWNRITNSFQFADGDVDLEPGNPIKSVTNISKLFNWPGEGGLQRVSIMGSRALIGGGKYLYLYDGSTVTDISSTIPVARPTDQLWTLGIGDMANNGSYWLVSVIRTFETSYLYRFDGTTWTDLSAELDAAVPRTPSVGVSGAWNGSQWLLTVHAGRLATYDGTTFTDITSQVPNFESPKSFGAPVWNGSYFLIPKITSGNHGTFYRYDGQVISELTELPSNHYLMSAGWNGKYWLMSGYNNQHLIKYDGGVVTDLGFPQHQGANVTWLKKIWIVGSAFFDGASLDITTPFDIGYRVNATSLGQHYGMMLGENGAVYRFDF